MIILNVTLTSRTKKYYTSLFNILIFNVYSINRI